MMLAVALLMLLCAGVPAAIFLLNLRLYVVPPPAPASAPPAVSILFPARNEAHGIEAAVRAALASTGAQLEIIVMDDASTDSTAAIVRALTAEDSRVRLASAPPMPEGWNGKQHACCRLAQAATHPLLCFVDADVRLAPECVSRMAAFLARGNNSLVSGFPRQVTGSTLEWLLLPLIHFVLLCFLPIGRMRAGTDPGFAAGCGQFMLVRAEDYFKCGGHSGIKLTMHDGLRLPKLFREHGLRTDLADLTTLASCRMYTSAAQVWNGLAKNAVEGIAAPTRIVPITILLLLGQVLPFAIMPLLLMSAIVAGSLGLDFHIAKPGVVTVSLIAFFFAVVADWSVRIAAAIRFKQDWRSALLHPVGILVLLVLQWYALLRKLLGFEVSWKSRAYAKPSA